MALRMTELGVAIRPMTAADVGPAAAEHARGGFGDRRVFLDFAVRHAGCDPIVAEADGRLVGTGVGTRNGEAGWVGVIYVAPEWRGQGLGRALSEAVCDRLEAGGCRTLVLVATDAGQRVYERLGFRVVTPYQIVDIAGLAPKITPDSSTSSSTGVRPFDPTDDLPEALALDRRATGEDRSALLRACAATPGSLALRAADGRLAAFLVRPPWHGGATIATDPESALRLLDERRLRAGPDRIVRAGLLASNAAGLAAFAAHGWRMSWTGRRMERGPALDMTPELIYGQFNFASG